LARWLERLQQYNFDVIYRKGLSHKNADSLSRRLCETEDYQYCVREKECFETRRNHRSCSLEEEDLEHWRQYQKKDSSISIMILGKETNIRPSHSEIAALIISAQIYWSYWDALVIKNGVLYKKWVAPNLKTNILQLVVLRHRVKEILEEAHDSSIGGHFGVNKTLEKVRKRFY